MPPQALRAYGPRTKAERLEARVTRRQKRLIERAAALRGTSVTDFVVSSAQQAAAQAVKDSQIMSLQGRASAVFVKALLHPPASNSAAKAAARRYRNLAGR